MEKTRLKSHLEKTADWAKIHEDGTLEIEHYDFSAEAQNHFGNDVAFLLFVWPDEKALVLTHLEQEMPEKAAHVSGEAADIRLLQLIAEKYNYHSFQAWLQQKDIPFTKQFDSWA